MPSFAGLDVSLKTTNICVLSESGEILKEGKVASEPKEIAAFLRGARRRYGAIVLESGSLARWLYQGLAKMGLSVTVVEARHAYGVLNSGRTKTDRNDARGLAQMARTGLFRAVAVKGDDTQRQRALMTSRDLLVAKAVDLELAIRGLLRGFGIKLGVVSERAFARKVASMIGRRDWLTKVVRPLVRARNLMREQASFIERELIDAAKSDPVCKRLMTAPGVGPIVALTYTLAIEDPHRFRRSRSVAAHLGLTQRLKQSGEIARYGRISCWGDAAARRALFLAGRSVLNPRTGASWLRDWGLQVAARRGKLKAFIAVARRLAVVLHRMWVDGTEFRWGEAAA